LHRGYSTTLFLATEIGVTTGKTVGKRDKRDAALQGFGWRKKLDGDRDKHRFDKKH
jgi:hypothetical protein